MMLVLRDIAVVLGWAALFGFVLALGLVVRVLWLDARRRRDEERRAARVWRAVSARIEYDDEGLVLDVVRGVRGRRAGCERFGESRPDLSRFRARRAG